MTAFASFLEGHQGVRRPARRRALVVVSAAAHAGALVLLAVVTMHVPVAPPPEPVLVRLSVPVGRPRPRPAPAPATPRQARRTPRPRLTQPALVAPPVAAPPAPVEIEEDVPAESEETDDAGAEPAGVPDGVPAAAPVPQSLFELREVARPPSVRSQVTPVYPREARRDGVEGTVVLRVIVGVDGTVERSHTRVVRSVPGLDAAAITAVESWRFSPALGHSGAAVRVVIEVPFQFYLR